jgi:hypothetical protein
MAEIQIYHSQKSTEEIAAALPVELPGWSHRPTDLVNPTDPAPAKGD